MDRDLGVEDLKQVPGNGLTLAILIRGQIEDVGLLQQALEIRHLLFLVGVDDVQRLEVVVDIDARLGPRLILVGGRNIRGPHRQVADVADGRLHDKTLAEVAGNGLGLSRGLDDDQCVTHGLPPRQWLGHPAE